MFRSNPAHTDVLSGHGVPEYHKLKWNFHAMAPFLTSPIVSGDTVYIGGGNRMSYAIDLATGGETWRFGSTDGALSALR